MTDKEKLEQLERIMNEYDSWNKGGSLGDANVLANKVRATLRGEKKVTRTLDEYMSKVNKRNTNMLVNVKEEK